MATLVVTDRGRKALNDNMQWMHQHGRIDPSLASVLIDGATYYASKIYRFLPPVILPPYWRIWLESVLAHDFLAWTQTHS